MEDTSLHVLRNSAQFEGNKGLILEKGTGTTWVGKLASNQLGKFKLSPFQKIEELTFPALALPQSENRNCRLSILGGKKLCLSR